MKHERETKRQTFDEEKKRTKSSKEAMSYRFISNIAVKNGIC